MALIRWKPQSELSRLHPEFDRMVESFFGGWPPNRSQEAGWAPPLNVQETDTHVVVDAELPGMVSDDVDVSIHEGVLTIKGEKRTEHEEKDEAKNFHRIERTYGSFQRRVQLPCPVDSDAAEAKLDKGVLHLRLPKRAEAGATKIGIKQG